MTTEELLDSINKNPEINIIFEKNRIIKEIKSLGGRVFNVEETEDGYTFQYEFFNNKIALDFHKKYYNEEE